MQLCHHNILHSDNNRIPSYLYIFKEEFMVSKHKKNNDSGILLGLVTECQNFFSQIKLILI